MRIITWNCNMAFRKKAQLILELKPDILVIPECEHPDIFLSGKEIIKPNDILWFGKNLHKGIGVFSYSNYRFTVHNNHNKNLRHIIPISVKGQDQLFNLFAIWANNPEDPDGQYIQQVWKAIHYYDSSILDRQTMLIGDFNSNTIWDKKRRESNHSNVVKLLEGKGILSAYHSFYKQDQGREEHPTFYLYKHLDKSYHLDYCFASRDLIRNLQSVEIGKHKFWSKFSDHVPVIITFSTV